MPDTTAYDRDYGKRLKERFRKSGFEGFYNYEMMELLLTYAVPGREVMGLSAALIRRFRGLRGAFDATADELTSVGGMRENTVIFIKLLKETAGAYLKERMMNTDVVSSPRELLDYLNVALSGERVEKFLAVYLNSRSQAIAVETLFEGTINQTAVYPRKAIEKAFKHNAHAVIFVHNHPSGDVSPSSADRELTGALERATRAVDLVLVDHIIVGHNSHFSARENGWLGRACGLLAAEAQRPGKA